MKEQHPDDHFCMLKYMWMALGIDFVWIFERNSLSLYKSYLSLNFMSENEFMIKKKDSLN